MTVGEYLRSLVFGLDLPDNIIERAAKSPLEVNLAPLRADEDAYPEDRNDEFVVRLDYASSTVYYAVLGVFAGGGYSEKVGDVSVTKNGYTITMADRERFQALADALRRKHGFDPEESTSESGICDMSYLRLR